MSELPRCTSWLGHKFEGRYSSKGPPEGYDLKLTAKASTQAAKEALELLTSVKTYERDICVRCGVTVEKPRAP